MNTITIELSTADRKALTDIGGKLDAILEALKGQQALKEAAAPADNATAPEVAQSMPGASTETTAAEASPFAEVSEADIRSKVIRLSVAGMKQQARDIINEYSEQISGIPADKRAEVHARLAALEG